MGVKQIMLAKNYPLVSCPFHVIHLLENEFKKTNRFFTYEKFFTEVFLPEVDNIEPVSLRNEQLVFILAQMHAYEERFTCNRRRFSWAIEPIKNTSCIPVAEHDQLVKPCNLIDVNSEPIARLYDMKGRAIS